MKKLIIFLFPIILCGCTTSKAVLPSRNTTIENDIIKHYPNLKNQIADSEIIKQTRTNEIRQQYSIINDKIIYNGIEITGTNISSFTPLYFVFAKDNKAIYCDGKKISTDLENFEILNYVYAKDKKFVFYGCKNISGVDANTFNILPGLSGDYGYAKDKNTKYIMGKPWNSESPFLSGVTVEEIKDH